jgi:hypothetical protein
MIFVISADWPTVYNSIPGIILGVDVYRASPMPLRGPSARVDKNRTKL